MKGLLVHRAMYFHGRNTGMSPSQGVCNSEAGGIQYQESGGTTEMPEVQEDVEAVLDVTDRSPSWDLEI